MNRTDWKDLAEVVGIVAIVASLVFVGLELRQTQSALMATTYQARAFDAIDQNMRLADSQIAGPIMHKALTDPSTIESLSDDELWRLRNLLRGVRLNADNQYYQYQQGYLDEEYFQHALKPRIARQAGLWRALGIEERRPSFKKFVDEQLASASSQ